jgi:hypothetical protein
VVAAIVTTVVGGIAVGGVVAARALFDQRAPSAVNAVIFVAVAVVATTITRRVARREEFRNARDDALATRQTLAEELYTQGVKPIARELFDPGEWELTMTVGHTPGLAELSNPRFEVSTRSRTALADLMGNLNGGAIGVAGPRGAGKSTLITSVCDGRTKVVDSGHVGFAVSAPVHYEPRDFVVHLLTSACEAVIRDPRALESLRDRAFQQLESQHRRRRTWFYFALAAMFAGAAAFSGTHTDVTKGDARTLLLAGLAAIFGVCAYAGWLRQSPLRFDPALLTNATGARGVVVRVYLEAMWPFLRGFLRPRVPRGTSLRAAVADDAVRSEARKLHRETKFQQSFSSGWSGSLTLPLGVEVGGDSTLSYAQVQMSLPELVGRLRDFLVFVATRKEMPVIVGIDELDKIGTTDEARAFLNGIKAVFGVPGIYFLVSVSQDAMSSFERRGLPFRDVFDSSFDEIVEARYFAFEETERLLRRRIIGMPGSFHALCHCLSGALPRDAIRVARSLVDEASRGGELGRVATALIRGELREKCHGTAAAVKNSKDQRGRDAVLDYVGVVERLEPRRDALIAACRKFPRSKAAVTPLDHEKDQRGLSDLAYELNAFVYFCATVLDVFAEGVTPGSLELAADRGDFERLAEARQGFALDHTVAWRRLAAIHAGRVSGDELPEPAPSRRSSRDGLKEMAASLFDMS